MDLSLRGKAAIVGGAGEGIGYAIARLLAAEGATVAMIARRQPALDDAVQRVRDETGSAAFAIAADIRKAADCTRIVEQAVAHLGRVDILVNNDGAPPLGELSSFDDAAWDKAVQQNLMSVVRLSRLAIPEMMKAKAGRIVNITALSTLQPMAKFGLSAGQPVNALLSDYPDAYLFATLCEAAPFLRDAELASAYEGRLQQTLAEINAKDARARAPHVLVTEVAPLVRDRRGL